MCAGPPMSGVSLNGGLPKSPAPTAGTEPRSPDGGAARSGGHCRRGGQAQGGRGCNHRSQSGGAWAERHPRYSLEEMGDAIMDAAVRMCPHMDCTSPSHRRQAGCQQETSGESTKMSRPIQLCHLKLVRQICTAKGSADSSDAAFKAGGAIGEGRQSMPKTAQSKGAMLQHLFFYNTTALGPLCQAFSHHLALCVWTSP